MRPISKIVPVGDIAIACTVIGEGTPVVVLHGAIGLGSTYMRALSELGLISHPAGRGIRLESRLVCDTHAHLTADPGSTDFDSLAGPGVIWLMVLEQVQHVLGAHEGPISQ